MKRNLILFGVFIALLGLTYFFQEKRVEDEHAKQETEGRVIQEEITHLKLPNFEATKEKGSWSSGRILLSHNSFKQVESKLGDIKKVKDIEGDWKNYFLNPIEIEVNHVKWTIGDLSLDKQAFYLARDKKIMLAVIEGESTHLTQDETEIASIKLNELVSLISKPLSEVKENQLFRFYSSLPFEQVVIAAEGNLPFELDFEKDITLPPPIEGISVYKGLRGKFFSLLTQMTIREEYPYSEKLKFKKLAEMKFISAKKKVTWELWIKDAKSADAFIIDTDQKRAFLMTGGTLKIFFIQVQDYWDKKVIPPKEFKSFTRMNATFSQGEKKSVVTILNREPLAFEVSQHKVDQLKMEGLIQLIFNLGPMDQANRVSQLSTSERKQILSENHLHVEVFNQELLIWRKPQEIIVVNLTQGFKAHFNLPDENFRGRFEDVLK